MGSSCRVSRFVGKSPALLSVWVADQLDAKNSAHTSKSWNFSCPLCQYFAVSSLDFDIPCLARLAGLAV